MGLRCMLGHDFDEPHVERDREEDGNEVIVTVREVKACTRCGEEQVVSENKEVTSIHARPAEAVTGAPSGTSASLGSESTDEIETGALTDAGASADTTSVGGMSAEGPNAESQDEMAAEADDVEFGGDADDVEFIGDSDESGGVVDAETDEYVDLDPDEDDGVILSDEDDEPSERGHGEWPDSDDVGSMAETDESTPWPEQTGEDEGFSAEVSDDEPLDVTFGGLAPQAEPTNSGPREGYDAEFVGNGAVEAVPEDDGFVRAEAGEEIDERTPTEYYCPACEMTRLPENSSMRPGDICPECRKGYVTEREQ